MRTAYILVHAVATGVIAAYIGAEVVMYKLASLKGLGVVTIFEWSVALLVWSGSLYGVIKTRNEADR
jgi:hypothetical protein